MSWLQVTFVVSADQVEHTSAMLESFLALAVTTENAGEDEFYEVAFPGTPDWQYVRVTGLFDEAIDLNPIVEFITKQLDPENSIEVPVSVSKLIDQDWEAVWLSSFSPIEVGKNLWVTPSWCEPVDPSARNIILDPGLAFGTGTHATTHMCLQWLADQNLQNQRILDYGSGTGILAIAAILSGAEHADAIDIDPHAIAACKENAIKNDCADQFNACLPDELDSHKFKTQSYNVVIANILASVLIELRDTLLHYLKPDGTLLLTGLLITQVNQVVDAYGSSFNFTQYKNDQWCLLIGTKS